jgi:hypothetical protein
MIAEEAVYETLDYNAILTAIAREDFTGIGES